MNQNQRVALQKLRDALAIFREIDRDMPLARAETILAVLVEGITDMTTLREYCQDEFGLSKSATARLISWWSKESYLQYKADEQGEFTVPVRPDGAGFIDIKKDPMDYRKRTLTVTPAGDRFGSRLGEAIIKGANELIDDINRAEKAKAQKEG